MIIDTHTHIFPPDIIAHRERLFESESWFRQLYASPKARLASGADLSASMEAAGVDFAVAFGFSFRDSGLLRLGNDYVLGQAADHPSRIVPFAIVNPAASDAYVEARRAIELGARGIGELVPDAFDTPLDDTLRWDPLCALAAEAKIPLLIHIAEQVGHAYPGKGSQGPEQAFRLAVRHPNTCFIMAHWGGGLPFYELMPEVAQSLRHVYYDTAASIFLYRDEILPHVSRWAPHKILFGSDYPLIGQKRMLKRVGEAIESKVQRNNILGGNAQRVLGMEVAP